MYEINLSMAFTYDGTEETAQRIITLATEIAQDVVDSHRDIADVDSDAPITVVDALAALFVEPHGPAALIDLEGVYGWSVRI